MAKKIKNLEMSKFTYEIVVNVGSYQSVRIGGEWSVTETPTTEQVVKIDAELRQKVAEVIESRKAVPAQPQQQQQPQPQPQPQAQPETKTEEETKTENKPEPKQVDASLEFVPSNSPKFQAILKKIQNGTPEETVRKYFRFDEKGEQIIAVAYSDLIKEHGTPIEDLKGKLPSKKQDKTQDKVLPKIP